jgi:hypothetical protein
MAELLQKLSVHSYAPYFRDRVSRYVDEGTVILQCLPSAQRIDLADHRVEDDLVFGHCSRRWPAAAARRVGVRHIVPRPPDVVARFAVLDLVGQGQKRSAGQRWNLYWLTRGPKQALIEIAHRH